MKLRLTTGVERRWTRHSATACVPLLVMGMLLAMSSSAAAAPRLKCGAVITQSTTLTQNLGKCSGNGLVVTASNITLNLGGYTITGQNGAAETVGILLDNVTGVTVTNGTVTGFDAGVNVNGGSANNVTSITARDNVNDNIKTGNPAQDCTFGDGITTTGSDANTISGNRVIRNGPYSGISLVEDSDSNVVRDNTVADNNIPNTASSGGTGTRTGTCGSPFARPIQDIGIRVEGPGADSNTVLSNRVTNSAIGGITIHGYVYCPPTGTPGVCGPAEDQNTANLIRYNYVADTGRDTYTQDATADGIGVLRQGPAGVVGVSQGNTINQNTVYTSYRHGIFLGNPACSSPSPPAVPVCQPGPYTGTVVTGNVVRTSLLDGILVRSGSVNNTIDGNNAQDNGEHDGHDANANCDANVWSSNVFNWVNQACVSPTAAIR